MYSLSVHYSINKFTVFVVNCWLIMFAIIWINLQFYCNCCLIMYSLFNHHYSINKFTVSVVNCCLIMFAIMWINLQSLWPECLTLYPSLSCSPVTLKSDPRLTPQTVELKVGKYRVCNIVLQHVSYCNAMLT